jgi:hypothetical protein
MNFGGSDGVMIRSLRAKAYIFKNAHPARLKPRRSTRPLRPFMKPVLGLFSEVSDQRQPEGFALQGLYQQHQPENYPAQ